MSYVNTLKVDYTAKELEKILENHEKYRLHDLRKSPNDYPKTKEPILIYFSNGVTGFGHTYRKSLAVICSTGEIADSTIIGWRYLVPFGVEE